MKQVENRGRLGEGKREGLGAGGSWSHCAEDNGQVRRH